MIQLLQGLSLLPLALAARLRRIERRAVDRCRTADAISPDRAVPLVLSGVLGGFVRLRLVDAGVLVAAADDRYYFSPQAYAAFRARRRKRALVVLTALLMAVALYYSRGV